MVSLCAWCQDTAPIGLHNRAYRSDDKGRSPNTQKNPPLTDAESKDLFAAVASKLQISDVKLMKYHDMPKSTEKFKPNNWQYVLGEKMMLALCIDKLIRK